MKTKILPAGSILQMIPKRYIKLWNTLNVRDILRKCIKTPLVFLFLYFFALTVFLAHFKIVGSAVYGDGRYYYAYLPSIFVYHTFNFTQAFKHLGIVAYQTPLHYPANKYSIGSALVWGIPFLSVNILLSSFHLTDGFNACYQIAIGIWNISLVFVGLFFLKKILQKYTSENIAAFTIIVLFLSTNLLFYGAVDVINSHSASFFAACMFIYFWIQSINKDPFPGRTGFFNPARNVSLQEVLYPLFLGFFLGLLTLIRSQDVLFIILPFSTLLIRRIKYLLPFSIMLTACFITYLPQILLWKMLWGTWYVNPYLFHEHFDFLHPHIFGVLFNTESGLFLWTPITIFLILGFVYFAMKFKQIGTPMLLLFLAELYTVASWSTWWQGASYSGRMFVSSLPLLAFGLAYLLSKKNQRITIAILLIFCILNPFVIVFFLKTH